MRMLGAFVEVVAVNGAQGESVELFELLDLSEGLRGEGGFAFEGVEDDSFEQVAEGHIFLFGDGFQDFEHAFFEADTGLDAFNKDSFAARWNLRFCHLGTNVPR